jgi:hypothetical protein
LIYGWLRASSTDIRISGSITNIRPKRSLVNEVILQKKVDISIRRERQTC